MENKLQDSTRYSGWRYTFVSLGNRDFRLLWFGMVCMMGGFQMQGVAQNFLVYEITGSAKILGLVSGGWAFPMLCLALFGGAIADRMDRKPIIQISQGISVIISLSVAVSILTGTVTWVYLLVASALQGTMFAFTGPARQAIIPQLVGRDLITNSIALNSAAMSSMSLIAPAIAGVLYAVIGPEGVYFVMGGLWLIAVTLTTAIHKPPKFAKPPSSDIFRDIKAGLSYVLHDTQILVLLGVMLVTVLLSMPFQFLLPVFVKDVYGLESEAMGLLVSMIGLGSLTGSLIIASRGRSRRGLLVIIGGFLSAISLMLIALVPIYWASVFIMVLVGLGNVAPMAIITALIMERSDEQYRGRMMSIVMLMWGLIPLGVLPLGFSVDIFGGRETVTFMGIAMFVIFSLILLTQSRLRGIQ